MIGAYLEGKQTDWDLNLGCLTPNMLMLRQETRNVSDLVFVDSSGVSNLDTTYGEYAIRLRKDLDKAHEVAKEHLKQASQKDNYNVKLSVNQVGDCHGCQTVQV